MRCEVLRTTFLVRWWYLQSYRTVAMPMAAGVTNFLLKVHDATTVMILNVMYVLYRL
jgi:hypothetical protein